MSLVATSAVSCNMDSPLSDSDAVISELDCDSDQLLTVSLYVEERAVVSAKLGTKTIVYRLPILGIDDRKH